MQVIMLVNDKKFVNKSLNVSCNIWHSLGIVKTIDSGDNNVDVMRKNDHVHCTLHQHSKFHDY